jgi:hypothetical protein
LHTAAVRAALPSHGPADCSHACRCARPTTAYAQCCRAINHTHRKRPRWLRW